ncbi:hypothetical protein SEA_CAVIAR_52 [Mycobacterium phage Caviar]|nr:hypothetical protein SEA_CAVIAR_52 [Mycobacterium phage Caviar]
MDEYLLGLSDDYDGMSAEELSLQLALEGEW